MIRKAMCFSFDKVRAERRRLAVMQAVLLPQEFRGGRLRRMRPEDLTAFQAYRALPELGRYQGWSPMSDTLGSFGKSMNRPRMNGAPVS